MGGKLASDTMKIYVEIDMAKDIIAGLFDSSNGIING